MNSATLCSLAGRYDNPIPPRFLAPIDFLKIPALVSESDLLAHFRILLGMSKLIMAQTLVHYHPEIQLSKKSGDQIADISVGSAATNFYDILAR
jgi:hypothetical protein